MADYYSPTVVQPEIPVADITELERLLLSQIFSAPVNEGRIYLYADERPCDFLSFPAKTLRKAFGASTGFASQIAPLIENALKENPADAGDIDIDLSVTSFECILQDIVRRSSTVPAITVVTSFMCNSVLADGFGGGATLITADAVTSKSTSDILEELQAANRSDLAQRVTP
jgi:hypothetical protein